MIFDITVKDRPYKLEEEDRFYYNNYSTKMGHTIPDIMRVVRVTKHPYVGYLITAKYENHEIYTKERVFSANILADSNLNPEVKDGSWVFLDVHKT